MQMDAVKLGIELISAVLIFAASVLAIVSTTLQQAPTTADKARVRGNWITIVFLLIYAATGLLCFWIRSLWPGAVLNLFLLLFICYSFLSNRNPKITRLEVFILVGVSASCVLTISVALILQVALIIEHLSEALTK